MKAAVIGGTAGIGRELANLLAARGCSLLIIGTDLKDINACTADLSLRYGVQVYGAAINASNITMFVNDLEISAKNFGIINYLFLPIGASNKEDVGDLNVNEVNALLSSNFLASAMASQIFQPLYSKDQKSGVIGFSSVAAIRGRNKNVIYSASKRALESYFESLKMLTENSNFSVQVYRLGFVDTYQSRGKDLRLPKMDAKKVAHVIINNLGKQSKIFYCPKYWYLLAHIILHLPLQIYRKLSS